jgi:hypothetical protein
VTLASQISITAGRSDAGSPWASDPPIEVGVRRQRPDSPVAVLAVDPVQAGHLAQVDQQGWRGQPQLHQRQQGMPAGQELGVLAAVAERLDRVFERLRRGVVEFGGNHAGTPPLAS